MPVHAWQVRRAARVVAEGGVIAYPTEAVYGLGCDPLCEAAVWRILGLKRRSMRKGLIVIAASLEQLEAYIRFPNVSARRRVLASWPGAVTWVVPVRPRVPAWLTGGRRNLAVRVSAHPVCRRLCAEVGPLVSTSANPGGCAPARTAQRVRAYFAAALGYIVPGATGGRSLVSEIRVLETGQILRTGGV